MIIGLTGYAQSGKDTLAKMLVEQYGFERRAFADPIRNLLYEMNPMAGSEPLRIKVDVEGWDKAKQHPEVRRLLQYLGVAARDILGDKVWINATFAGMELNKNYVITDIRFLNEARALKDLTGYPNLNTYLWRVTRTGVGPVNGHVSESQMDTYDADVTFDNSGTIEDLELMVKTRMQGLL